MSSKSITVNIAEGMGKQASAADVLKYMRMAMGSCDETRVWLDFGHDLGYIASGVYERLYEDYLSIGRMIKGIMRKYQP